MDYVAVLLGARKFTPFAHPNEQISRIIRMTPVRRHTVLLQLENPVRLTQYVNPICLASLYKLIKLRRISSCFYLFFYRNLIPSLMKKNNCLAVARNGALLTSAISISSLAFHRDSNELLEIWWNKETIHHLPVRRHIGL